jgi:hypothetical protein
MDLYAFPPFSILLYFETAVSPIELKQLGVLVVSACSPVESELGTGQPQLVSLIFWVAKWPARWIYVAKLKLIQPSLFELGLGLSLAIIPSGY